MKKELKLIGSLLFMMMSMAVSAQDLSSHSAGNSAEKIDSIATSAVIDDFSVSGQFETLLRKSTLYKEKNVEYRVVKEETVQKMKKDVIDTLKIYYAQDDVHQIKVKELNSQIGVQEAEITRLNEQVSEIQLASNSVKIFSAHVPIATYSLIVWLVIIVLVFLLVFIFTLYKRSSAQVHHINNSLKEVQDDFEQHRKNALAKEQKMARELLDVKIKNNLI
ncbi:MAG: hypothetical protein ACK5IJ_03895 [Mangrovibacterium sp.]